MNNNTHQVFDHVLIIMFENQYRSYVMENEYFHGLARQGIDMANYFGVMHPSQTNYISSIAGELCNMTDDNPPPSLLTQRTIVDLIEESPYDLDWRAYMDSYIPQNQPWSPTLQPKDEYPYMIKHNPFSSFESIVRNKSRWHKVQNEAALYADLLNGTLPAYSWFTPNMWNDGHYLDGTTEQDPQPKERAPVLVDQAANWLKGFFASLNFPGPNSHLPANTLVVVTFDEADFEALYDPASKFKYYYDGPNQIYTVLLGDMIESGGVAYEGYNHYSLIKTIEKNYGLSSLEKNDKDANWFRFLWDETFIWESPEASHLVAPGHIAAASFAEVLYVVYDIGDGSLYQTTLDVDVWSEPQPLGIKTDGAITLVSSNSALHLVFVSSDNELCLVSYTLSDGWSARARSLAKGVVNATIATYNDNSQLMLVYTDKNNTLYSINTDTEGKWQMAVKIGFSSEGAIQLGVLGPSIYLIYQDISTNQMMVCSYNTADYNVVTLQESAYNGPQSNTSLNKWSPNVYPVAHFSAATYPGTPKEKEPVTQPYTGKGPLAVATLDGVMHLVQLGVKNDLALTETFSIHGIMTPEHPISYNPGQSSKTNSGYGILVQAGWSDQSAIHGVYVKGDMCMTTHEDEILLIYNSGEGQLSIVRGGY